MLDLGVISAALKDHRWLLKLMPRAHLRMKQSSVLLTCQSLPPGTKRAGLTVAALPLQLRDLTWLSAASAHIPYAHKGRTLG